MTIGIAKQIDVGPMKGVIGNKQGVWDFIYSSSLVRDPRFYPGDRVVLPDGREFRYAKSSGECASGQSVDFDQTGALPYTAFGADAAIGDKKVVFLTGSTHDAYVKDELRGGFFVSWPAALKDQFRGIVGNDASVEDGALTVYLDGPLTVALTTAMSGECYENPYASVKTASDASLGKGGVPAVYVAAADTYFWVQNLGFAWVAPQTTVTGNEGVGCFFRHDGSLEDVETTLGGLTIPATDGSQYAGHRVIGDASGNGPLFCLK